MGGVPAHTLALLPEARRRPVLHLHPLPLARPVRVAVALRDDPLEAALTRRPRTAWRVLEPGQAAYADREAGGL